VADAGYIAAGYGIVLGGLTGYAASLFARARRARRRASAIAAKAIAAKATSEASPVREPRG
jgi:hypothetical protein